MEIGPRFEVSFERPEKRGIDLTIPGLVGQRVIHYTTAAPMIPIGFTLCNDTLEVWAHVYFFCLFLDPYWRS